MQALNLASLTHTYSIIAFDPEHHQLGGAMQTHNFQACDAVIWLQPGVAAIASQAESNPFYALAGFELLRLGKTAQQVLPALLQCDARAEHNQVAMVDVQGNVAAHTGAHCIRETGHRMGPNYSCQANIMQNDTVWEAMAGAYESSTGELVERLMAALEAAEQAGGDIRGAQSAVIKIVTSERTDGVAYPIFDFRVYDSPEPLKELRRLIDIKRAHDQAHVAHNLLYEETFDDQKLARSLAQFNEAVHRIPNRDSRLQHQCFYALSLLIKGKPEVALPLLKTIFATDPRWREVARRAIEANADETRPELLELVLAQ